MHCTGNKIVLAPKARPSLSSKTVPQASWTWTRLPWAILIHASSRIPWLLLNGRNPQVWAKHRRNIEDAVQYVDVEASSRTPWLLLYGQIPAVSAKHLQILYTRPCLRPRSGRKPAISRRSLRSWPSFTPKTVPAKASNTTS